MLVLQLDFRIVTRLGMIYVRFSTATELSLNIVFARCMLSKTRLFKRLDLAFRWKAQHCFVR